MFRGHDCSPFAFPLWREKKMDAFPAECHKLNARESKSLETNHSVPFVLMMMVLAFQSTLDLF